MYIALKMARGVTVTQNTSEMEFHGILIMGEGLRLIWCINYPSFHKLESGGHNGSKKAKKDQLGRKPPKNVLIESRPIHG